MKPTQIDIAIVGAGPVGLALALHASRVLPHARVSLFDRRGRRLELTATGQRVFAYADSIFALGEQMLGWLDGRSEDSVRVRVGSVATMLRRGRRKDAPRINWPVPITGCTAIVGGVPVISMIWFKFQFYRLIIVFPA